jgi:hypothetical protein
MNEEDWLDLAVLEYISNNNGKVGSPEIVDHFRLRCDITLFSIDRLENAGKIKKKTIYANKSVYVLSNEISD